MKAGKRKPTITKKKHADSGDVMMSRDRQEMEGGQWSVGNVLAAEQE